MQHVVRALSTFPPPCCDAGYAWEHDGVPEVDQRRNASQPDWEAPAHSPMPMTPTGSHRAGSLANVSGASGRAHQRTNSTIATLT